MDTLLYYLLYFPVTLFNLFRIFFICECKLPKGFPTASEKPQRQASSGLKDPFYVVMAQGGKGQWCLSWAIPGSHWIENCFRLPWSKHFLQWIPLGCSLTSPQTGNTSPSFSSFTSAKAHRNTIDWKPATTIDIHAPPDLASLAPLLIYAIAFVQDTNNFQADLSLLALKIYHSALTREDTK